MTFHVGSFATMVAIMIVCCYSLESYLSISASSGVIPRGGGSVQEEKNHRLEETMPSHASIAIESCNEPSVNEVDEHDILEDPIAQMTPNTNVDERHEGVSGDSRHGQMENRQNVAEGNGTMSSLEQEQLNATANLSNSLDVNDENVLSSVGEQWDSEDNNMTNDEVDSVVSKVGQKIKSHKLWNTFKKSNKRLQFLDRIALVSNAMLDQEHVAHLDTGINDTSEDLDKITVQSDLTLPGRHISVVTTAALPWFTGTSVNPLLRAAYLHRATQQTNNNTDSQWVTLVIPWLELPEDQRELYGASHVFQNEQEQEEYIRGWLRDEAKMQDAADPRTGLKIMFYPARYHSGLKSIFAMGDVCSLIPHKDVCILEEPEHLNWYRAPGQGWTKQFNYVVGIVHTNYKEYASAHYSGLWTAPAIAALSSAMIRAYCHKVIKLSDVLQTFAPEKEHTSNVHGVRSDFLERDEVVDVASWDTMDANMTRVYFIGKILWAKGLDLLLEMQRYYRQCTGDFFPIDIYGSGPEMRDIVRAYHGRKQYKKVSKRKGGRSLLRRTKGVRNLRQKSSDIRILGTRIPFTIEPSVSPLFSKRDDIEEESHSEALSSDETSSSSSSSSDSELTEERQQPTDQLDQLQAKARKRLRKLKRRIKSTTESLEFDIPKSLSELRRHPIPASFPGRVDHAALKNDQYKVFVNPSITEVLCTTTAEALAMGKFVIIPVHPSNTFFLKFPNCLAYRNKFEFAANLKWALAHEPEPLTPELAREFTWEAATERFIQASAITIREARGREKLGTSKLDERIAWFHNEIGKGAKGDTIRKVLGAGPVSDQHRYQKEQEAAEKEEEESEDDMPEEDADEGLPRKFRRSSLAEAIRSTVINGLPTMIT